MKNLEQVTKIAKETIQRDGYHVPLFLLFGDKGVLGADMSPIPEDSQEKMKKFYNLGVQMAKEIEKIGIPQECYFITEAWFSMASAQSVNTGNYVQPSKDPKREECLLIDCSDLVSKESTLELFVMKRDLSGKLENLLPLPKTEDMKSVSNVSSAFKSGLANSLAFNNSGAIYEKPINLEEKIKKLKEDKKLIVN